MKVLLDTHAFLWLVADSSKLTTAAAAGLADPSNDVMLSVASIWELAIKIGTKKLTLSDPLDAYVTKWTAAYQIDRLPIRSFHALAVLALPDHHRDPFDRMLIAQAQTEGMNVVTADPKFTPYGIPILW